jgi:hypothetical protein
VNYNNTSQSPNTANRTINFVVNDGDVNSNTASKTVSVTAANDAPVVTTTAGITGFTEDGGPVVVDSGVTVTDADDVNLESATVSLASAPVGGAEVLNATSCAGLTVTPGNPLTISGSQPLATYQTCLQSVTYNNTSQSPNTTNRTVNFVVNDGDNNSNTAGKTVSVTAVNDAPVVTTTAGVTSFTEDGGPVVIDSGVTVTDVDDVNLESAVVSLPVAPDGPAEVLAATSCGFYGSSALADPSYGLNLFTPANVPALAGIAGAATSTDAGGNTITNTFSNQELALLAAFYQSAAGVAGGVFIEYFGRDYHGEDPQAVIAPRDIEEARAIVMFLAACDKAQSKGAMVYLSNGQAIAAGTQATTNTIGGNSMALNSPIADGDAGGSYNAGLILFYDPAGSPPAARFTGKVDTNGNVKIDSKIASSRDAVAGLYLSALQHIGADVGKATAAMQKVGIARSPSDLMLF